MGRDARHCSSEGRNDRVIVAETYMMSAVGEPPGEVRCEDEGVEPHSCDNVHPPVGRKSVVSTLVNVST